MGTSFINVYNRFLDQITDDLYVELTLQDTLKDIEKLLINSLPAFEFPRVNLFEYTISTSTILKSEISENDFVIMEYTDENDLDYAVIEQSCFAADLTDEEILIISKIMLNNWLQRQITSIENTRMKYSGTDFKMTSQANHLSKLITLQDKIKQEMHHYQRLYHRRRFTDDGLYRSNWDVFKKTNYWYDN